MIKIKRLLATFLDVLLILLLMNLMLIILSELNSDFLSYILFLSSFSLLVVKDFIFKNRSLGKRIMGIEIVCLEGFKTLNKTILIKRNFLSLLFGIFYPITVLMWNRSLGDSIYETTIRTKKR